MLHSSPRRLIFISSFMTAAIFIVILFYQDAPQLQLPATKSATIDTTHLPPEIEFEEVGLAWGVATGHKQSTKYLSALTDTLGAGVCVIDANKDGWMDLFVIGGSGHTRQYGKKSWWHEVQGNRLLLNQQGQYFEDVTEKAGLSIPIWGMGCAVADFNNDGLSDLIITGVGKNLLLKNNGDLSFSDLTKQSGIQNNHWSTGASIADFNQDGLVDIYISNYILFEKKAKTFERTSGFRITTNSAFDQTLYDPEPNRLYLNKGNFQFDEVAEDYAVSNSLGRSLGAKWTDINNDGWPDLLVINDHSSPNQIFINNQGQSFIRDEDDFATFELAGSHDVVAANFDNSSNLSYFFSRGMNRAPVLLAKPSHQNSESNTPLGLDQSFNDQAWLQGLANARFLAFSGWGITAADFNNDSYIDLYVANGSSFPDLDTHFVPQAQSNLLYINNGQGKFTPESVSYDALYPYSSRGVISVDLDNDGRLELVVSNNNDALQIFENSANNKNWFGLELQDDFTDAEIYGAQLTIKTEAGIIHRLVQSQQSFLSQGDRRIHIGLNNASQVKELIIDWPSGSQSIYKEIKANYYYRIDRSKDRLDLLSYTVNKDIKLESLIFEASDQLLTMLADVFIEASIQKGHYENQLLHLWRKANLDTRKSILAKISHRRAIGQNNLTKITLLLLQTALKDKDPAIRLEAISLFKLAEKEESVAWLLPYLFDVNTEVQCKVAKLFQFFFEQEEALTHRKYLAISPLIRLLEQGQAKVIICAANALAAAENKRAYLPLMNLALKYKNTKIRNAAIRALGLIRDTSALSVLRRLVADSNSPPSVVAISFISLFVLNDPEFEKIFSLYFSSNKNSEGTLRQFETLESLFLIRDSVVLPKVELLKILQSLLTRKAVLSSQIKSNKLYYKKHNKLNIIALKTIAASKSELIENQLYKLMNSTQGRLEHKEALMLSQYILKALAFIDTPDSRTKFLAGLATISIIDAEFLLNSLVENEYVFTSNVIDKLFFRQDYTSMVINLFKQIPKKQASTLFAPLLNNAMNNNNLLQIGQLLALCRSAGLRPDFSNQFVHNSDLFKIFPVATLDCFLQWQAKNEAGSSTGKSHFRRSQQILPMLHAIRGMTHIELENKNRLLIKAADNNPIIAKTILADQVINLPDKWILAALEVFEQFNAEASIESSLRILYKSEQLIDEIRLKALWLLFKLPKNHLKTQGETLPPNKEWTIDYLLTRFFATRNNANE